MTDGDGMMELLQMMIKWVGNLQPQLYSGKISILSSKNSLLTFAFSAVKSIKIPESIVSQTKSLKINVKTDHSQEITITYI